MQTGCDPNRIFDDSGRLRRKTIDLRGCSPTEELILSMIAVLLIIEQRLAFAIRVSECHITRQLVARRARRRPDRALQGVRYVHSLALQTLQDTASDRGSVP